MTPMSMFATATSNFILPLPVRRERYRKQKAKLPTFVTAAEFESQSGNKRGRKSHMKRELSLEEDLPTPHPASPSLHRGMKCL